MKYNVCTLDVWGNENDGFEVNDSFKVGTINLYAVSTDEQILNAISLLGYNVEGLEIEDYSDNSFIAISEKETGKPVFNIVKI